MFKILNRNNGQASMSQYVIVFFLAIGALVAMTTFVQRALQARIRDTRNYMLDNLKTYGNVQTNMHYEYEPYYANVSTTIARSKSEQSDLVAGGVTGIFRKNINSQAIGDTVSTQAPPKDAQ